MQLYLQHIIAFMCFHIEGRRNAEMKHVIGKLAVIGSLLAFCGCAAEAKTAAAEKEGVDPAST